MSSGARETCGPPWGVDSAVPSTRLALGTRRGRPEEVTPPALGFLSCSARCQRSSLDERQSTVPVPLPLPLLSAVAGGVCTPRSTVGRPLPFTAAEPLPLAVDPRRGSPASVSA